MVQAVGFGLRYKTPVGPVRADFAYTINPPQFVGFNGTPLQLLNCNPNAASGGRVRTSEAEHQPFPVFLFHRTDVLTMLQSRPISS